MYVLACQLYEDEGRPLPRHRLGVLRPEEAGREGWLTYKDVYNMDHKRTMKMATLRDDNGADVFPPMLDADMLIAENGVITVRGQERCPVSRKLTAMAWWCRVLRGGKPGYQGDPDGPTLV